MRLLAALLTSVVLTITPLSASADAPATQNFSTVDAQVVLNAYQGLVEEHLSGVLRSAKVIALSTEAKSAKWEKVKPLLDRFSEDLETDATVWFAMPDGRYYATEAKGLTDQNLKDRSYFPSLMAGKDVEGDLVVSKSTGHRSVIVAKPVKVMARWLPPSASRCACVCCRNWSRNTPSYRPTCIFIRSLPTP